MPGKNAIYAGSQQIEINANTMKYRFLLLHFRLFSLDSIRSDDNFPCKSAVFAISMTSNNMTTGLNPISTASLLLIAANVMFIRPFNAISVPVTSDSVNTIPSTMVSLSVCLDTSCNPCIAMRKNPETMSKKMNGFDNA